MDQCLLQFMFRSFDHRMIMGFAANEYPDY